jgi:hypothetical protein
MKRWEELETYTIAERRYLYRYKCGWCGQALNKSGCGAVYDGPCNIEARHKRRRECLASKKKHRVGTITK